MNKNNAGFSLRGHRNLLSLAGICDLDLSSSALYAGDSGQYSLIAGFCHSQPVIRRALYRPGLSSRFRRGPLARECPVAGTLPPPAADSALRLEPRLDHVGCHASRSPENLAKEGPVK